MIQTYLKFQIRSMDTSGVFQVCFMGVTRKLFRAILCIIRKFQESFKVISGKKLYECFTEKVVHVSFKIVLRAKQMQAKAECVVPLAIVL